MTLHAEERMKILPPALQKLIADPRIFALGAVSPTVYAQLLELSKESEVVIENTLAAYEKAMQNYGIPHQLREEFVFHDCRITSVELGDDLLLELDCRSGFTSASSVLFRSCTVQLNEDISSNYWLYDELYKVDSGYEVHILTDGEAGLAEMTLFCQEIEIH